jgi:hypothetical protein
LSLDDVYTDEELIPEAPKEVIDESFPPIQKAALKNIASEEEERGPEK